MKCKATQFDTVPLCEAAASQNGRRAHQRPRSCELLWKRPSFESFVTQEEGVVCIALLQTWPKAARHLCWCNTKPLNNLPHVLICVCGFTLDGPFLDCAPTAQAYSRLRPKTNCSFLSPVSFSHCWKTLLFLRWLPWVTYPIVQLNFSVRLAAGALTEGEHEVPHQCIYQNQYQTFTSPTQNTQLFGAVFFPPPLFLSQSSRFSEKKCG